MSIVTPVFRVSYPNVFKPRMNQLSQQEEYSLEALFPKDADLKALEAEATKALEKAFGKDKAKWPKNLRNPFKNQGDKAKTIGNKQVLPEPYEDGAKFLNLKCKTKPGVVDAKVQPIIEAGEFYAGCWAQASVNVYTYSKGGNNGVNFSLNNIQKVKDGEPLGARTSPSVDFVPVAGADEGTSESSEGLFE